MFRFALAALATLIVVSPALANMPPKALDHPYSGKALATDSNGTVLADKNGKSYYWNVRLQTKRVAYTDDRAAYRMCDMLHRAHYGTPYNGGSPLGVKDMPRWGCTMYDPDTKWLVMVTTFDTPAIAKKRLAKDLSKQQYDQCMAFNSTTHELGHVNAYTSGDFYSNHQGWGQKSRCTYDRPAPPVPSS